ncbi:MAG: insulinase family protein [Bacteroidales bacterium]|nr:insulinase family protein [Bacteroidales bacterium]MBN2818912.1 insulinase family protein [Bacteroidales bacterium]
MEFQTHTLSNGIRLIYKQVQSPVAHCGLIINTGSRDEDEQEHGMAHLIEHLIFKGTKKRKAFHILSRMEDVGGELNAYTTKEETCIHTTFFNNYYARAFELIRDIVFNSIFPPKEILKEKEIIFDEINSYKDSPVELIFDDFEELIFKGNPIARNILGTEESLLKFEPDFIKSFYSNHYSTEEMVVSSVGSQPFSKVKKQFEAYFGDIRLKPLVKSRIPYIKNGFHPEFREIKKDTHQAHCLIGGHAYSHNDHRRLILHLLNNYIGGPGLNSLLNLVLREKKGFAYNVESNYTLYSDVGIISIYFGVDNKDVNKSLSITRKELLKLCNNSLGITQLSRAKNQIKGQIAISADNNENQMLSFGKSLLVYNKVDELDTILKKIDSITASQIMEVAQDVLHPDKLSTLIYN